MGNALEPNNSSSVCDIKVNITDSTVPDLRKYCDFHGHNTIWVSHPLPPVWSKKLQTRGPLKYSGISRLGIVHGQDLTPFEHTPFGVSVDTDHGDIFHGTGDYEKHAQPPKGVLHHPRPGNVVKVNWQEKTKLFTVNFGTHVVTSKFPEEPFGHHEYYFYFTLYGLATISIVETVPSRVLLLLRNRCLVLSERAHAREVPDTKCCSMVLQVLPHWFFQKICVYLVE